MSKKHICDGDEVGPILVLSTCFPASRVGGLAILSQEKTVLQRGTDYCIKRMRPESEKKPYKVSLSLADFPLMHCPGTSAQHEDALNTTFGKVLYCCLLASREVERSPPALCTSPYYSPILQNYVACPSDVVFSIRRILEIGKYPLTGCVHSPTSCRWLISCLYRNGV